MIDLLASITLNLMERAGIVCVKRSSIINISGGVLAST